MFLDSLFEGVEMINRWAITFMAAAVLAGTAPSVGATLLYNATNEGFTVGTTPPTTGPLGAPTSIDCNLGLTVANGGSGLATGNFLRLTESPGEAPDFRYDIGANRTSGIVSVSMNLLFEGLENYHVYFRETSTSATSVANIRFGTGGGITIQTVGGSVSGGTYAAGTAYLLEANLDLDADLMDVFLNGALIAGGRAIHDVFGAAIIGFEFSSFVASPGNFDGVMQVDNFRVSVPEPGTLALLGLGLVAVATRRRKRI